MTSPASRAPRRSDGLSRERIVGAAIEILDATGEQALTMRTLTAHLATGRGAIYHHVSGMEDLLAAAVDDVVTAVTAEAGGETSPTSALRALAVGIFDAVDRHPWVGAQLGREPMQPAVLRIWKSIGGQLRALGITGSAAADAGSAFSNYVFGATARFAAGDRHSRDPATRQQFLDTLAAMWTAQDADVVVSDAAAQLRTHDDRAQFAAGVEILLRGIAATHDEPA